MSGVEPTEHTTTKVKDNMPYMYILECADGSYYTGSTWHLERRIAEHNAGIGANYTAKKHPARLVFCEEFSRIDDAFYREKQVQGWSHAKKKALIEANWESVRKLAECMNDSHCKNASDSSSFPERSRREQAVARSSDVAPFDSAQGAGKKSQGEDRQVVGVAPFDSAQGAEERSQGTGEKPAGGWSKDKKENHQPVGERSRTNRKEESK